MTTHPIHTPRYMVRVTIPADGATPSEAARKFVEHVTLHGFSSLTYNVEDLIEGERYLATLEGWATLADVKAELGDDKGTIWIQSVDPELVEDVSCGKVQFGRIVLADFQRFKLQGRLRLKPE